MIIVRTWDLPAGFGNKHQHANTSGHNKLRQAQEMHQQAWRQDKLQLLRYVQADCANHSVKSMA